MDFWNIAVPALTFLAPLAAIAVFLWKGKSGSEKEINTALALFCSLILISTIGIFHFETPIKMEFLWALAMEPSGYFEFSLQLHWIRYVWIFFSAAVFAGFVAQDGAMALQGERKSIRLLLLTVAFLFSSLAFLSENTLLSLMFIEITVFLLHAFSVEMGGAEAELERVSYFKRSSFIFLGLAAMLCLAAIDEFSTNSIVLMGVVLYIMSLIFSKHNYLEWRYLPLSLIQAGTAFFLLGRVMREDMSAELWMPLSAVFALATAVFSGLSLLSLNSLNASFWLVFGYLGYLLFLRFSSGRPDEQFWGTYEAIGLFAAYAVATIYRFGSSADQLWKKVLSFLFVIFLLGIVSGAVPGVELAAEKIEMEHSALKLATIGVLTFLVSAVTTKALLLSFQEKKQKSTDSKIFFFALLPALLVFCAELGAVFRILDVTSDSAWHSGIFVILKDLKLLVTGSALLFGAMSGALVGSHNGFVSWIRDREKRMEDLFPRIDPAIIQWNQLIVTSPERGIEWFSQRMNQASSRAAILVQEVDKRFFAEKFYRGFFEYGSSLSQLVRFLHSGNFRAYMFMGVLVTLFASLLFILGGR